MNLLLFLILLNIGACLFQCLMTFLGSVIHPAVAIVGCIVACAIVIYGLYLTAQHSTDEVYGAPSAPPYSEL